jgi:diaminopimelate decarboxylase
MGTQDFLSFAEQFGTPLYIYDAERIKEKAKKLATKSLEFMDTWHLTYLMQNHLSSSELC